MVRAEDVRNGYGYKKPQPYNSILPYLRGKAEKATKGVKTVTKPEDHKEPVRDQYAQAKLEILRGDLTEDTTE